ncbi:MAG: DUF4350 domain-containing protein [Acidobacteria bacterium]|nr:DUF4350 domain-containing protein [Acidobacteriota bacterium]
MNRRVLLALLGGCAFVLFQPAIPAVQAQQQIVYPEFKAVVEKPAYERNGPVVAIDEAHSNFHKAGGQYKPFADLLTNDGYTVKPSTLTFNKEAFAGFDVLVIANALSANASQSNPGLPAFTDQECDSVRDWVQQGGSLLLIADHAPFGSAAENLAKRFGVVMGKGWAFDRSSAGRITTQLIFSRENGFLGSHPILRGRDNSEEVNIVRSFTGQSLTVPDGATSLLKMSSTAREAPTPDDLDAEATTTIATVAPSEAPGSHSSPAAGHSQGIAMTFGRGRVVILGEAGMFSAQIVKLSEGAQQREFKFGMNVPGNDNRQFALNVLHWLSGLLK